MSKPVLYVGPYAIMPLGNNRTLRPYSCPADFMQARTRTLTVKANGQAHTVLCLSPLFSFSGPTKFYFGNRDELLEDDNAAERLTNVALQREEIQLFLSQLRATFPLFIETFSDVPIVFGALMLTDIEN